MQPRTLVFLMIGAFASMPALAQVLSPAGVPLGESDAVLARQGDIVLTQGEIDAAFSRIPEVHRLAFIRNGERVDQLIRSLLQNKMLAAEAAKDGYDETPLVDKRLALASEKELAEAWIEHVVANAPEADYEALAYEAYLANPEQWMSSEILDVSHLLISSENKSDEKALAQIEELSAQVEADPSRFDALIMEYSEDPSKDSNKGRFQRMFRGQMVAPFEEAAFAIETPGEITGPVKTSYGYHLIRLNGRTPREVQPFETVREPAIEQARKKHIAQYRSNYLRKLAATPVQLEEGAVEAMAKRYFGENLELAPDFKD